MSTTNDAIAEANNRTTAELMHDAYAWMHRLALQLGLGPLWTKTDIENEVRRLQRSGVKAGWDRFAPDAHEAITFLQTSCNDLNFYFNAPESGRPRAFVDGFNEIFQIRDRMQLMTLNVTRMIDHRGLRGVWNCFLLTDLSPNRMTRILGDTFYEIVAEAFKIMAQRIAAAVGDDLNPTVARYMAMARRMEEKDNETR